MIERLLPSSRIQKTTSRIALIGLAAATMMITLSVIGAIQLQEASAAKPTGYCYNNPITQECFENAGVCHQFQRSDTFATSRCYSVP